MPLTGGAGRSSIAEERPHDSSIATSALALMHEYTASDALRKHMYAVEIAMRAMAERAGEDPEAWGIVGLLHDFDYERYPNDAHSADRGAPGRGSAGPGRSAGFPSRCSGPSWGTPTTPAFRATRPMARALFAVDELCGFLVACALVRPSRSLQDLEVSSVKKKLKDKAFARGVSREDVTRGAEEIGVPAGRAHRLRPRGAPPARADAGPRRGRDGAGPGRRSSPSPAPSTARRAAGRCRETRWTCSSTAPTPTRPCWS